MLLLRWSNSYNNRLPVLTSNTEKPVGDVPVVPLLYIPLYTFAYFNVLLFLSNFYTFVIVASKQQFVQKEVVSS